MSQITKLTDLISDAYKLEFNPVLIEDYELQLYELHVEKLSLQASTRRLNKVFN